MASLCPPLIVQDPNQSKLKVVQTHRKLYVAQIPPQHLRAVLLVPLHAQDLEHRYVIRRLVNRVRDSMLVIQMQYVQVQLMEVGILMAAGPRLENIVLTASQYTMLIILMIAVVPAIYNPQYHVFNKGNL